jgi:hypothetical protein
MTKRKTRLPTPMEERDFWIERFFLLARDVGELKQAIEWCQYKGNAKGPKYTPKDAIEILTKMLVRADPGSDAICNNSCKDMYFCELPKGHKGMHREGGLGWPQTKGEKLPPLLTTDPQAFKKVTVIEECCAQLLFSMVDEIGYRSKTGRALCKAAESIRNGEWRAIGKKEGLL